MSPVVADCFTLQPGSMYDDHKLATGLDPRMRVENLAQVRRLNSAEAQRPLQPSSCSPRSRS